MTGVLAVLNYVVSLIATLLGVTQSRASQQTADTILAVLTDPAVGLAAVHATLATVLADIASVEGDVLALGNPQQTDQPVTLPTVPPDGYGGASADDVATAVWEYGVYPYNFTAFAGIATAAQLGAAIAQSAGIPLRFSEACYLYGDLSNATTYPWPNTPEISLSSILPTDASILAWLERIVPGFTWQRFTTGNVFGRDPLWPTGSYIWCALSDAEFYQIRANNNGLAPGALVPPVWPGLAGVTLGAAHAMVPPGEDIAVACDGVIIEITGTPSWAGSFSFGTAISWRNVGAVTFTTDNGQEEYAQTFSWSSGVYLPKSQIHASGYAYRAAVGVSGTITPFTVNS